MLHDSTKAKRFNDYKNKSKIITSTISRINMLIGLKVANSLLFILLLLKRIELSKEMLILDIDNRNWTVIPPDLSQERLPASFRFYDFVINHI